MSNKETENDHLYPHEGCARCGAVFETVKQRDTHRCPPAADSANPLQAAPERELKPCPFCGSPAFAETPYDITCGSSTTADCWKDCAGHLVLTDPKKWNTRADATPAGWQEIESPPETDDDVLVLLDDGEMEFGFWDDTAQAFDSYLAGWLSNATHWQPLPPPPQKGSE